jgi:hypothetical protein
MGQMSPTIIETEVVCRAVGVCYLDVAQIASSKDDKIPSQADSGMVGPNSLN